MNAATFPAVRANGTAVQLAELLAIIPDNDLTWSLIHFYGVGEAPNGLSMVEFEKHIHTTPGGFAMTWSELKQFAKLLHQVIDCLIVGAISKNAILHGVAIDDFSSCEVVLSLFDSTEWSVWARDPMVMKKLALAYG